MKSSQHPQTSDTRHPKDVLRKFIADLKDPLDAVENSLDQMINHAALDGAEQIISQFGGATESVTQSIQSVIDYLQLKLKNGLIDPEGNIALEILGRFSHVLRESSAPLQGFVNVVQHVKLTEDELVYNKEAIKYYGKRLVRDFKLLDSNWRVWLETRKFDWEASDL